MHLGEMSHGQVAQRLAPRAAIDVEVGVEVRGPLEEVWGVMLDLERWPEWTPSVRRVERLDDGRLASGSRVRVEQPRLPRAIWRVVSLEDVSPGYRSFEWEAGVPGFRSIGIHEVIDRPGRGSEVRLSLRTSGVIARLLRPFVIGITERYVRMEAHGLKARIEGEQVD